MFWIPGQISLRHLEKSNIYDIPGGGCRCDVVVDVGTPKHPKLESFDVGRSLQHIQTGIDMGNPSNCTCIKIGYTTFPESKFVFWEFAIFFHAMWSTGGWASYDPWIEPQRQGQSEGQD